METYVLKDDVKLLCVNAPSFPEGIAEAHERLRAIFPQVNRRKFYGVSHPEGGEGKIIYKAAVEESFSGEGDQLHLETFTLKKGSYMGSRIINYADHMESITATFQKILKDPRIDPHGCCVEKYLNEKDVQCMVRLESKLKVTNSELKTLEL